MDKIYQDFHIWLDKILSRDLPSEIKGFAINLYENVETFDAELIGAPSFDENDEDWACDDIFMSDRFEFPRSIITGDWESALEEISNSLRMYLKGNSDGSQLLKSIEGVSIGFVDGNLLLLYKNA